MTGVKRKLMALILPILLCLLITTGCGAPKTALDPQKPVTVTLWHYYAGDVLIFINEAVEKFNQTIGVEKGVVIDAVGMGSLRELEQSITNSVQGVINAQPMPDIFSCYPDKALEIDGRGKIIDLRPYFNQQEKDKFVPSFLQEGYFSNQRLLLLPIAKSTEILYINYTAWQKFCDAHSGICDQSLANWESLYEAARAFYHWTNNPTPDNIWNGKAMLGLDSVANYIIAANKQLGVEIINADKDGQGNVILDEQVLQRIFDIYYQGYSLGYFDAVGRFRSDDVKTGDLIAYIGSSSGASYFPAWVAQGQDKKEIDLLPAPYPVFNRGQGYTIQQGAGMGIAPNGEARQEGAALFLKWFTSMENNIDFAMASSYLPVQQDAYISEQFLTALANLKVGDKPQHNAAGVYEISLLQVTEQNTYAARPFPGSYDVRILLQNSLMQAAEKGRARAAALKQQNKSEQEVLGGIDTHAAFEEWLDNLEQELTDLGVDFKRINQDMRED